MMDYSSPQTLGSSALGEYILGEKPRDLSAQPNSAQLAITGVPEYRKEGIEHWSNDVFCDVMERVNIGCPLML
jgi:hypothetical protein